MVEIARSVDRGDGRGILGTARHPRQRRSLCVMIEQAYRFALERVMRGYIRGNRGLATTALGIGNYDSLQAHESKSMSKMPIFQ